MTDTQNQLREHCEMIAKQIQTGEFDRYCEFCGHDAFDIDDATGQETCAKCKEEAQPKSAMDYLSDVLDIQYIVSGKREYLGARVLVAFGGPNIWIDTQKQIVEGHWWNDSAKVSYSHDGMDLDGALSELWNCN